MSFGGKTLLPDFGKYVAQYIGNDKIAKVVKLLIDALGEVGEGEISYAGQQFGRWLTWQNDKDLKEMFTKEDAWDNAITTFVMTLLLKGGSVVKANVQADYVTGKNVNKAPEMGQGLGENVANQEKHGTIWETEFDKLLEKDAVEASEQLNVKGDDTSFVLGEGGTASIFRNGELYENFIEVDGHRIEALAEIEIDGDRLILRDIAIYSNEGDIPNKIGASAMKEWLGSIKEAARGQGFKQVQIIGQRAQHSTSANPGSIINRIFDLE